MISKKCSGKFKVDGRLNEVMYEGGSGMDIDDSDEDEMELDEVEEALTLRENIMPPAS